MERLAPMWIPASGILSGERYRHKGGSYSARGLMRGRIVSTVCPGRDYRLYGEGHSIVTRRLLV
jgi:hypothetical protein